VRFVDRTGSFAIGRFLYHVLSLDFSLVPRPACVDQAALSFPTLIDWKPRWGQSPARLEAEMDVEVVVATSRDEYSRRVK
jgi:hypothetical protein